MLEDTNFSLDLEDSWQRLYPEDRHQYTFVDDDRDIMMILSSSALDITPDDLDFFANLLVELQLQSETMTSRVFGQAATIYEPIVAPQYWGRAIAFYGHDAAGRQFNFSAMLTCRCKITLYMWSNTLSERDLSLAMDEIASRIVFERTPLDPQPRFH